MDKASGNQEGYYWAPELMTTRRCRPWAWGVGWGKITRTQDRGGWLERGPERPWDSQSRNRAILWQPHRETKKSRPQLPFPPSLQSPAMLSNDSTQLEPRGQRSRWYGPETGKSLCGDFCKEPDNKEFRFCGPYGLCHKYWHYRCSIKTATDNI